MLSRSGAAVAANKNRGAGPVADDPVRSPAGRGSQLRSRSSRNPGLAATAVVEEQEDASTDTRDPAWPRAKEIPAAKGAPADQPGPRRRRSPAHEPGGLWRDCQHRPRQLVPLWRLTLPFAEDGPSVRNRKIFIPNGRWPLWSPHAVCSRRFGASRAIAPSPEAALPSQARTGRRSRVAELWAPDRRTGRGRLRPTTDVPLPLSCSSKVTPGSKTTQGRTVTAAQLP